MALIKGTILAITASDSPDVTGYKLYMVDEGVPLVRDFAGNVDGAQVFDLGDSLPYQDDGKIRWDLATLPSMTTNDGVYDLGIAAVDDAGNESSFLIIPSVPLDFVAPNAPTDGTIERP